LRFLDAVLVLTGALLFAVVRQPPLFLPLFDVIDRILLIRVRNPDIPF